MYRMYSVLFCFLHADWKRTLELIENLPHKPISLTWVFLTSNSSNLLSPFTFAIFSHVLMLTYRKTNSHNISQLSQCCVQGIDIELNFPLLVFTILSTNIYFAPHYESLLRSSSSLHGQLTQKGIQTIQSHDL